MDVLMPHDLDMHGPLRRGGGGSGAPIVVPLGFMLIALALCSLIAFRVKQSNLMVALTLGVIAGGTGLSKELKPFEMDASIKSLPGPLVDALVEIGIVSRHPPPTTSSPRPNPPTPQSTPRLSRCAVWY